MFNFLRKNTVDEKEVIEIKKKINIRKKMQKKGGKNGTKREER